MTNQPATPGPANAPRTQEHAPAVARQALLKDIRLKWGKFSEQELTDLKSNDDLVTQLAAKYSMDKAAAQRDVDTLRAGRNI